MIQESGLAMAFWGEALAMLVHVWSCCPTAAVDNAMPYELWHGCKPDVSHLQVWGFTAYVHVQKDKRPALHPHYDKCVLIGYPPGYKGWKFYNPTTKFTIISECANFDECPVNTSSTQHPAVANHQQLNPPNVPYVPPELPDDVDDDEPVAAPEMPPAQGELQDEDDNKPAALLPAPVVLSIVIAHCMSD